jgi:hypothetical protein
MDGWIEMDEWMDGWIEMDGWMDDLFFNFVFY